MNGYDLRDILDMKCVTCVNDNKCKIKEWFLLVSKNFKQNAVNIDYIEKSITAYFLEKKIK